MIEDIMHCNIKPDQIKITLRRDRLTKKNKLAVIELYKNQQTLRPNTILQCNLSSYTAAQGNLKPLLQKAKAEGRATWKHLKASTIKIGFVNLTLRGNTLDTKRM